MGLNEWLCLFLKLYGHVYVYAFFAFLLWFKIYFLSFRYNTINSRWQKVHGCRIFKPLERRTLGCPFLNLQRRQPKRTRSISSTAVWARWLRPITAAVMVLAPVVPACSWRPRCMVAENEEVPLSEALSEEVPGAVPGAVLRTNKPTNQQTNKPTNQQTNKPMKKWFFKFWTLF